MLERIEGNGVRTIIVETASRFARDLMVQEVGHAKLREQGIDLIAADSPGSFIDDTPTAKLVRQVLGAISEFDKAMTVAKLRGAPVNTTPGDSSARGDSTAARSSDTLRVPRAPGRIDCARPALARRTSCRRERKCGKHRQARAVQRTTSQHDHLTRLPCPGSRAGCHRGPIATRPRCHPDCAMLQSSGLANTPCWACHFEGPPPKHPNDPPGTGFQEAETKGPKTLAAIDVPFSESCRSRITPPTRPISHAARNSPVAHDCVVGPGGLEPPTRPL